MDVRDLDRIGFVTRHFHDLKGLQMLVPVGMVCTMQALMPLFDRLPVAFGAAFTYGLAGMSWILAGLLDHRQLVRTLGQHPPDLGEAGAAVEEAR